MLHVICLCVYIIAVFQYNVCGSKILWNFYGKVYAKRLPDTFGSSIALAKDHYSTSRRSSAIAYGCSSYQQGSIIADKVREGIWKSIIKPIAVDFEKDFMCFMLLQDKTASDEDLSEVFEWVGPALPSLKVHDSVYGFVESSEEEFKWRVGEAKDLTIYFRDEVLENFRTSNDHFTQIMHSLNNSNPEALELFHWTSSHPHYHASHDYEAISAKDRKRRHKWLSLTQLFHDSEMRTKSDLCKFQELNYTVENRKVIINIENILMMKDFALIRSCIAFLTATFAGEKCVNHVALTTRARSIQQTGHVGVEPWKSPFTSIGLLGDGQLISLADTGIDLQSCYFYDPQGHVPFSDIKTPIYDFNYRKVVMYTYSSSSDTSDGQGGDGTFTSCTVAGSIANADLTSEKGRYAGVAPNARIAFMDCGVPGSYLTIPSTNYLYGNSYIIGARVHTNSWGNYYIGSGYYCNADVDEFLFNTKNYLIFFSAGDNGGVGDGMRTITMDAASKNVLAIGASETTLNSRNQSFVSWYSSKGPVYDGRIKPDLVAPGDQLMSARSAGTGAQSCDVFEMTGTSMASPAAAGAALLVRQYFMDINGRFWTSRCNYNYRSCRTFEPSGPLVKAILVTSTDQMKLFDGDGNGNIPLGQPPDIMQGFGRITLINVLAMKGINNFDLFVDDAVTIGQYAGFQYHIVLNDLAWMKQSLRVTLCWYDPPNIDGTTANAVLQDLNLHVVDPDGITFFPNNLRGPDYLNTIEHIRVNNPQNGVWRVFVSSNALPVYGYQEYSLVITSGGTVYYGES